MNKANVGRVRTKLMIQVVRHSTNVLRGRKQRMLGQKIASNHEPNSKE